MADALPNDPELQAFVGSEAPTTGALPPDPELAAFTSDVAQGRKYGTPDQLIQTGVEGLARGATFGLSDAGAVALGDNSEEIKARKTANPVLANLSQIAGGAGLLYGTGGAAAPIAGALESVAVPSLAAHAIGMGVEGAAFGAGNAVSDAALGEPNLTAQKVLADVGLGFALGSGLGVLSEGVKSAIPSVAEKLGSSLGGLKETVFGTEENPSLLTKALSVPGGITAGMAPSDWSQALFDGLNQAEAKLTVPKLIENLDEIHESSVKAAEDLGETLEKVKADATPLLDSTSAEGLLEDHKVALKDFQRAFMTKKASGEFVINPQKIETFFSRFNEPSQALKREALDSFLKSSSEVAKASENFAGFKDAEGEISKHISELAKKQEELNEVAEAMRARVKGLPSRGRISEVSAGFLAHSLGVPNPVTGAALASVEAYRAISNPYALGATLGNTAAKLRILGDLSESVGQKIGRLSKNVFALPAAETIRSIPGDSLTLAATNSYDKKVKRIQELATNPSLLYDHVTNNTNALYEAAPNVTQGIQSGLIRGVEFLDSKIPRSQSSLPGNRDWEPSKTQKMQFERYYRAVNDPLNVLKEVKNGTLTSQTMEALQNVHPELLQEMRRVVTENLDPKRLEKMKPAVRISLGQFLGHPLDQSVLPQVLTLNQASLSGPQLSQQGAPKQTRSTLGGLKQLTFADQAATQTRDVADEKE